MTAPTVLGVDPGGTWCGLVVRRGDELLAHEVVTRPKGAGLDMWCNQVLDVARELTSRAERITDKIVSIVAVEQTTAPSGHMRGKVRIIDPGPALDTAQLGGALYGWGACRARSIWIPPGGHGQVAIPAIATRDQGRQILLAVYPEPLVPARAYRGTSDLLRHCRSAWDIAAAGARITHNVRAMTRGAST